LVPERTSFPVPLEIRRRGAWKVIAAWWKCELMTRLRMEDGRADGNLIVEEGIFLGKGEPAVETAGGMTGTSITGIRTWMWKLSYNSGGSRFRI
jgi:hypothetical protein